MINEFIGYSSRPSLPEDVFFVRVANTFSPKRLKGRPRLRLLLAVCELSALGPAVIGGVVGGVGPRD